MRSLSIAELDLVSGGLAGWDSSDWNSAMGDTEVDHAASSEAQARAMSVSLWIQEHARLAQEIDWNGDGVADAINYYRLDGSFVGSATTVSGDALLAASDEADRSGYFACVGGGVAWAVAGACVGTPLDLYLYGGVGTPGLSVSGGYSTDTSTYLTGLGGSVVMPVPRGGFGTTADGSTQAIVMGTPGISVTYGISVSDTVEGVRLALEEAARQLAQYIEQSTTPGSGMDEPLLPN